MPIKQPTQRIMVRACVYRDNPGFSVYGKRYNGGSVSIFTRTEEGARKIQAAYKTRNEETIDRVIGEVFDSERESS